MRTETYNGIGEDLAEGIQKTQKAWWRRCSTTGRLKKGTDEVITTMLRLRSILIETNWYYDSYLFSNYWQICYISCHMSRENLNLKLSMFLIYFIPFWAFVAEKRNSSNAIYQRFNILNETFLFQIDVLVK